MSRRFRFRRIIGSVAPCRLQCFGSQSRSLKPRPRPQPQPRPPSGARPPCASRHIAPFHLPSRSLSSNRKSSRASHFIGGPLIPRHAGIFGAAPTGMSPGISPGMCPKMSLIAGYRSATRAQSRRHSRTPLRLRRLGCLGVLGASRCKQGQRNRHECGPVHEGECGQSRASPVYVYSQPYLSAYADSCPSDNSCPPDNSFLSDN